MIIAASPLLHKQRQRKQQNIEKATFGMETEEGDENIHRKLSNLMEEDIITPQFMPVEKLELRKRVLQPISKFILPWCCLNLIPISYSSNCTYAPDAT
jgi:hypothetical protein